MNSEQAKRKRQRFIARVREDLVTNEVELGDIVDLEITQFEHPLGWRAVVTLQDGQERTYDAFAREG